MATPKAKEATTGLLGALKRHEPFRVRVYASDDDYRDVAVPTRRRRWASVIEAIESRTWSRCVFLDKSGAELGYYENKAGGGELEDLTPNYGAGIGGQVLLAERMVAMVIKAQKDSMALRSQETESLLTAQGAVVREMSAAVRDLASIYREQTAASTEAATARAQAQAALTEASQAGGDEVSELLKHLPLLLQALPMLKSMLGAPPAVDVPSNGARKTS